MRQRLAKKAGVEFALPSPYLFGSIFAIFVNPRFVKVAVYMLILVFGTSAGAYASFQAVPGDILYGVKTKVIEKAADFVAFTPREKAKRNSAKIETRIKEVEVLAERGEATEKHTKNIEKELKKNFAAFDENIKEIKRIEKAERGATLGAKEGVKEKNKLETDLETNLKEHKEKIRVLKEKNKIEDTNALEEAFERVKILY